MDPQSWVSPRDKRAMYQLDVSPEGGIAMAIVSGTSMPGRKDGVKLKNEEGPHQTFTLPPWFAELKKELNAKIAIDRKANPLDTSLPVSLLYYGSERVQAREGMGDAWTIEIKGSMDKDAKRAWLSVHEAEWKAASSKEEYIQKLEDSIKEKVKQINEALNKAAFDKKAAQEDKEKVAKGGKFAWAVKLKEAVWKELLDLKAKDHSLTDIPERLTLLSVGEGDQEQMYFDVWIQEPVRNASNKGQMEYRGAPLAMPILEDSVVSDWIPPIRQATAALRKDKGDHKEVPAEQNKRGTPDSHAKPAFPASLYAVDLSEDLTTVPSATNKFGMILNVRAITGGGTAEVAANMSMLVYYYWSVYKLPRELRDLKDDKDIKTEELVEKSTRYVLDDKPLGKQIKSEDSGTDSRESLDMDDMGLGDFLLMGHGQPTYTDDTQRAGSYAAFPFSIQDPTKRGRGITDAETEQINALKEELQRLLKDPSMKDEAESLQKYIADREARNSMDISQLSSASIADNYKLMHLAHQIEVFIEDDRKQHIGEASTSRFNNLRSRMDAVNPKMWLTYQGIRKQYDPTKFDSLAAVKQYKADLMATIEELEKLGARAKHASVAFGEGSPVYRVAVTMINEDTGEPTSLMMQMGLSKKPEEGQYKYNLVDVSAESMNFSDTIYLGHGEDTVEEAIENVFEVFGQDNRYCTGKVEYRVPGPIVDQKGKVKTDIRGEVDSYVPVTRRITGAIQIAGMAAVIVGSGIVATLSDGILAPEAIAAIEAYASFIGVSAAVIQGGMAIANMKERSDKGTLRFDAETGMDLLTALGGITAFGGSLLQVLSAAKYSPAIRMAKAFAAPVKLVKAYKLVDSVGNVMLIGLKVKEDLDTISAMSVGKDQKAQMVEDVVVGAIQQGAILGLSHLKQATEALDKLQERIGDSSYHTLKEKGYINEEGKVTESAPLSMREGLPENAGLRAMESEEESRKEALVMGMASGKTKDGDHKITITENGRIIRCSYCEDLREKYRELLSRESADQDPKDLVKRLDNLEKQAKRAAESGNRGLADVVKQKSIDLDFELANRSREVEIKDTPYDTSTLPEIFRGQGNPEERIKQMRMGGMSTEEISAILENAAQHQVNNPKKFLNNLGMAMAQRKNARDITVRNTDVLLDGLMSSNKRTFDDARALLVLSTVGNQKTSNPGARKYPGLVTVDTLLNTFSIEDLRSMTKRPFDNEFVTGIYGIAQKMPEVGKTEMMGLMNDLAVQADKGEEGWQRLADIMDDPARPTFTVDQVKAAIVEYDNLRKEIRTAMGDPKRGFAATVRKLWGGKARVTGEGKYQVETTKGRRDPGYGEELFNLTTAGKDKVTRTRMEGLVEGVFDDAGNLNRARLKVLEKAVLMADVPEIIKSAVLGELWNRIRFEIRKAEFPDTERNIPITDVASGVPAILDSASVDRTNKILYLDENKAREGDLTPNQEKGYKYWKDGFKDPDRNLVKFKDREMQKLYTDKSYKIAYGRFDMKTYLGK